MKKYIILVLALLYQVLAQGPIENCEDPDQLLADEKSCTRYHRCRQLDVEGNDYTTDIAICPYNKVFDMVLAECVDSETGFLQDPSGCTTYYGCHPTPETSEGFRRNHYECPGDLRFHPEFKICTFKTNVPDNLCNSYDPDQAIIGSESMTPVDDNTPIPGIRGAIGTSVRKTASIRQKSPDSRVQQNQPDDLFSNDDQILTKFTQEIASSIKSGEKGKSEAIASGALPKPGNNLNRIAELIQGQLINLGDGTSEKLKQDKVEGKSTGKSASKTKEAAKPTLPEAAAAKRVAKS